MPPAIAAVSAWYATATALQVAWVAFQVFAIVSSVYGASQAKKKAKADQERNAAAQKAAYNASLKDRTITRIAADSPAVTVYGRARVGSAIFAVFTSGTRDEYKHLICVHAAHECDAFEEIYINSTALGTLDGDGFPTTGKYASSVRVKKHLGTAADTADATLISECPTKWDSNAVLRGYCYTYIRLDLNEQEFQGGLPSVEVLLRGKKLYDPRINYLKYSQMLDNSSGWTAVNCVVTANSSIAPDGTLTADSVLDDGTTVWDYLRQYVTVENDSATYVFSIYVKKTTGGSAPTFGAYASLLNGTTVNSTIFLNTDTGNTYGNGTSIDCGDYWRVYKTITNNSSGNTSLGFEIYPAGGLAGVGAWNIAATGSAIIWGAQLELGTTPTDYSETEGATLPHTDWSQNPALVIYDYLTSEMCGVSSSDLPSAQFITAANVCDEAESFGNKYTFNGTVTADQDQAKVLEQMAQSMAGSLVSTTWDISAGKYVAPVLALQQEDIVGSISIIPGTSDADLYNGVKGQYISSETLYVATDFKPYQNATYVTTDGGELWTNIDFPFTDSVQRVHNLARIFTEDQRNGYTVKAGFSLKAWDLKIGQRVTLTSELFGWSAKIFRVTDKTYSLTSPVELTLKEDAESIWDYADEVTADSTPNTDLPDPFSLAAPENVAMTEELYETTGSAGVKSKAILTWDAPAAICTGYLVEYKGHDDGTWIKMPDVNGTRFEFLDMAPGVYDFQIAAKNFIGGISEYTGTKTFTIYGLTAAPGNVANFNCHSMGGMALASWDLTTDLDVKIGGKVQIRHSPLTTGAVFANGVIVPPGSTGIPGDAVSALLPLASGTYMAKFIDSTGNFSATEATFVVTEALVSGWTTVVTSTQHSTFTGTKTDCTVSGSNLIFSGSALSANYAYSANIDGGSVAVRRYHGHIKASAYVASDLISARGLISTWGSISSTSVINGCDAYQEIRVSDDAATWSAWTKFTVADFSGRYAQVRLQMLRDSAANNIEIQELKTTVKIPA